MSAFALARDDHSTPFFDAAAQGRLLLRHDPATGRWYGPATRVGPTGEALEWAEASGRGTLEAWTVLHGKPDEEGRTTRGVGGIVELDEGPWLRSRLVGLDPAGITDGLRVQVAFPVPDEGEPVPVFGPAA